MKLDERMRVRWLRGDGMTDEWWRRGDKTRGEASRGDERRGDTKRRSPSVAGDAFMAT